MGTHKQLTLDLLGLIQNHPEKALSKWNKAYESVIIFVISFGGFTPAQANDFASSSFSSRITQLLTNLEVDIFQKEKYQKKIKDLKMEINNDQIFQNKYQQKSFINQLIMSQERQKEKENEYENYYEQFDNQKIQTLQGNQIQVTVKYFSQKMDIGYTHENMYTRKNNYGGKKLKTQIQEYVRHYFRNNIIRVSNKIADVSQMQGADFQKSPQAGNYYFDPFFDCVRFEIRNKNGEFNQSFRVKDNVDVKFVQVKEYKQWNNEVKLTKEDSICKFIKFICNKLGENKQSLSFYMKQFVKQENIKIVKDIFSWEKQSYQKLKLKTNFIIQTMELVEKIKYQSGNLNSKQRKTRQQKKTCIKTANSHKILRYVVYKTKGFQQLQSISNIDLSNMMKAIEIVREEIINDQLLNQLQEYFYQFTHVSGPQQSPIDFSRGLVLFGPPGTGKTQLTQKLPNLIGFHLITIGLSAADFMKSLVGESSRMISALTNRGNLSPHLLCSIAIDEVDGLAPDRKDKDEKNKGQGISMLLSVIGGIKDVPNLVYLTSTNHLKKIDQAVRRRLSGQYQVGRPNPQARQKILQDGLLYLRDKPQLLKYLVKITSNFTGAALKRLNTVLNMKISKKSSLKKPQNLTYQQVTEGTAQIAKQFNITLGMSTFPEIYANKTNKNYIFSMNFFQRTAKNLILVSRQEDCFQISYATQMQKYVLENGVSKLKTYHQVFKDKINIQFSKQYTIQSFLLWLQHCLHNPKIKVCETSDQVVKLLKSKFKQPTIGVIQELGNQQAGSLLSQIVSSPIHNNLYLFCFVPEILQITQCYGFLGWELIRQHPYSGRLLIQLNDEPQMAFELNNSQEEQTKFSFRYFMKTEKQNTSSDILPELIEFFTQRKVSYILLIQYQLMLQNAAYDQQKMLEVIQQKMAEAMNYNKVAVIINLDSLIVLNQSSSDSSMGRSVSYSVADQNMYRLLLNYMRQFAFVGKIIAQKQSNSSFRMVEQKQEQVLKPLQKQKWLGLIIKNPELAKLVKKDLNWYMTPSERKQQARQEQRRKQKQCCRCYVKYTEQQNEKERKCMGHPGPLIHRKNKSFETTLSIFQAQIQELNHKERSRSRADKANQADQMQNVYVFACCLKGVNEQGDRAYRHITKDQKKTQKDELNIQREQRKDNWLQVLSKFT